MNLTKEAKIHLATKVDNWKEAHGGLYKPGVTIFYGTYNPHETEGAKYLRCILMNVSLNKKELHQLKYTTNPEKICLLILNYTGYTGKVHEVIK